MRTRVLDYLVVFVRHPGALAVCALAAAVLPPSAAADTTTMEMDEVVVTGLREQRLLQAPRSMAVITAEDIANSASSNLVDLLAHEANVNLRSFFGNDKFSGVDIRGMGDTFVSNVLVLIDGVRLNAIDLSGVDFSSIPLDQIERIEIIRGANVVRYGNGAVGGVINILTRRHILGTHGQARLTAGSFDNYGGAIAASSGYQGLELDVRASLNDSDGYRDNGTFYKKDGSLNVRFRGVDWLDAYARADLHEDRYGIPGPVSATDFRLSVKSRQSTRAPDDHGSTIDRRYRAGLSIDGEQFGRFSGTAAYRNRTNPFVIGYTPLLSIREQESTIESVTRDYEGTYTLPLSILGRQHELVLGYQDLTADYERRENGRNNVDRSRSLNGAVDDRSGFVSSHWSLPYQLALDLGYRRDVFGIRRHEERLRRACDVVFTETVVETTVFVEVAPGVIIPIVIPVTVSLPVETNCRGEVEIATGQRETWHNSAWEAGLSWQPASWSSVYLSHQRSFRNPNIDELTLATTDLSPQYGKHWELGFRAQYGERVEVALSLFHMQVEDEIFFGFDPVLRREVNRNLDEGTTRAGAELELRFDFTATLSGWTNMSYLNARIDGDDTFIPLVPRNKIAAGLEWEMRPSLVFSASCSHVGRRYDGNDFDNQSFDHLDAYHVVDAKLRWRAPHYSLAAGVSNALDAVYATAGYSGTIYPMAPRSFLLELAIDI